MLRAAAAIAARGPVGGRGRQRDRRIDVEVAQQSIDHERGAHGYGFVAAQLPVLDRLAHGFSISRCAVTPKCFRNLRIERLNASSSMELSPVESACGAELRGSGRAPSNEYSKMYECCLFSMMICMVPVMPASARAT